MSHAFTRESDDDQTPLPERAVSSHPNLVTAAGQAALEARVKTLGEERQAARAAELGVASRAGSVGSGGG